MSAVSWGAAVRGALLCATALLVVLTVTRQRRPQSPPSVPAYVAPRASSGPTVLVTGGTGMLGSSVCRELRGRGYRVVVLVRQRSNLAGLAPGLRQYELVVGDVLDQTRLRRVVARVQPRFIYHFAAQALDAEGERSPELTLRVNVLGSMNLLEAVRAMAPAPFPRILFAGSSAVYGAAAADFPEGIPETAPAVPQSVFGVSKLAAEALARQYWLAYRVPSVLVRLFPQIGVSQSALGAQPPPALQLALIEQGLAPPVLRYGNLGSQIDISDAESTAPVLVQVLERGEPGEAYNVGSGSAVPVHVLLKEVAALTDHRVRMEDDGEPARTVLRANVSKLLQLTAGRAPTIDLPAITYRLVQHWRQQVRQGGASIREDDEAPAAPPAAPPHPPADSSGTDSSAVPVLITGVTGMIGSHVGAALLERGYKVYALVRWRSSLLNIAEQLTRYEVLHGDILDRSRMREVIAAVRPRYIYHFAAQAINSEGDRSPDLTLRANILGTLNLLEASRVLDPPPRILFAGSSTVYGTAAALYPQGVPEDGVPLEPVSVYGVSKLASEALVRSYWLRYRIPSVTARFFIQIGAGHSEFISIQAFSKQIAMIEMGLLPPVLRHGNLKTFRDMSDVRVSAPLCVRILEQGAAGESYNFGTGEVVSIESLLRTVVALSRRKVRLQVDPARFRNVDEAVLRANVTKLRAAIGAAPTTDMNDTAKAILDYWRLKVRNDHGANRRPARG